MGGGEGRGIKRIGPDLNADRGACGEKETGAIFVAVCLSRF